MKSFCVRRRSDDSFKIAWSISAGWIPWEVHRRVRDHEKVGRTIRYRSRDSWQINDYIEVESTVKPRVSLGRRGCHSMDALFYSFAGGVDTTGAGSSVTTPMATTAFGNEGQQRYQGPQGPRQIPSWSSLSVFALSIARALDSRWHERKRDVMVVNTGDADIVLPSARQACVDG